jgi:hypothetical protein
MLLLYVASKYAQRQLDAHIGGADLLPLCGAVLREEYEPRSSSQAPGWQRYVCADCRALAEREKPTLRALLVGVRWVDI